DGKAAGSSDQALQFVARRELRRLCAGVVVNLLFDNRAIEIVRTEPQRNLRDTGRKHDPVGFDVIEIVEQKARDGYVAKVIVAGWLRNVRERGIVRVKCEGDKRDETARDVLKLAQLHEVVDAFLFGFYVSVEHRRIRT